jgi:hypothetical protein
MCVSGGIVDAPKTVLLHTLLQMTLARMTRLWITHLTSPLHNPNYHQHRTIQLLHITHLLDNCTLCVNSPCLIPTTTRPRTNRITGNLQNLTPLQQYRHVRLRLMLIPNCLNRHQPIHQIKCVPSVQLHSWIKIDWKGLSQLSILSHTLFIYHPIFQIFLADAPTL